MAYAVVFCLAFTAAVLSAPVFRLLAVKIGAVDRPDGKRKIHTKPVPRLGGLVVSAAMLAGVVVYFLLTPSVASRVASMTTPLRMGGFAAGFAIILGLGIWDDIKGVRPRTKILFQTLAVIACYSAGFRVEVPLIDKGQFALLSFPMTWFWLVACINAMNLVDGMDGLAGGVAFFAASVIFVMAALYSKLAVALMSAALLGSVVGFLMYNFHPAVMFLGDSGSMMLGYVIATLAIAGSLRSHATVALLIPILALGLPIMDTLLAILRRWSRRLPISQADREHVHHKLLAMGLSHREAVLVLYGACLILGAGALIVASANNLAVGIVLGGICVAGAFAVRAIGTSELAAFISRLGERLRASGHEKQLAAAKTAEFCLRQSRSWEDVCKALEPYLKAVGRAGAEFRAEHVRGRVLARLGAPLDSRAHESLCGDEPFALPSGRKVVFVLDGRGGEESILPEELRRSLLEALVRIEKQGRETEPVDVAASALREGLAAP